MDLSYRSNEVFNVENNITIDLPTGVTYSREVIKEDKSSPLKFPTWKSWAGLEGWCDTIEKKFNWSRNRAFIALMDPEKDCDWVSELSESQCDLIVESLRSPFKVTWNREKVKIWIKKYNQMIYLNQWLECPLDERFKPKSRKGFDLAITLSVRPTPFIIAWFNRLEAKDYHRYSHTDMWVLMILGRTSPKLSKLYDHIYGIDTTYFDNSEEFKEICNQIDLKYMKFSSKGEIKALLDAGVHPTTLVGKEFTKAEACQMVKTRSSYTLPELKSTKLRMYMSTLNIPVGWYEEIRSREVADWANSHVEKLDRTREIHGPAGAMQTMHYHQLLYKVTPGMLPQGPKTAWRKVIGSLEEVARLQIQEELGKNVELPQLKHPEMFDVERIKTSFELKKEGELMGHCVGGYVRSCLSKKSYIYHIGDVAPKGATLEVCYVQSKFTAQQMFIYKDKPADADLWEIANLLVASINRTKQK